MNQPNSEPSEQARKLQNELTVNALNSADEPSETELAIIQRHLDAYHEAQSKELVKDKERLDWLLKDGQGRAQSYHGYNNFCHEHQYRTLVSREQIDTAMKGTKAEVER